MNETFYSHCVWVLFYFVSTETQHLDKSCDRVYTLLIECTLRCVHHLRKRLK